MRIELSPGNLSGHVALVLLAICAPLIAGGALWASAGGSQPQLGAVVLGDASGSHLVEIHDANGVSVLYGEFRSRVDGLGNTEKDAALFDRKGRNVIGEVEIEIPAPGRQDRRPELEIDIISLPPRQRFSIVIDDRVVGQFITDDRGSVDMEVQEGEVPSSR